MCMREDVQVGNVQMQDVCKQVFKNLKLKAYVGQNCMVQHGLVRVAKNQTECGTWKCNVVCSEVKRLDAIQRCDFHCCLQCLQSDWREELSIKLLEEDPEKNADYLQAQVAAIV